MPRYIALALPLLALASAAAQAQYGPYPQNQMPAGYPNPASMFAYPPQPATGVMPAQAYGPMAGQPLPPGMPSGVVPAGCQSCGPHVPYHPPAPSCCPQPCGPQPCCPPTCCPEPCKKCCFFAGAGTLYVQPRWQNNPAYLFHVNNNIDMDTHSQESFDYDYTASPRAWIGFAASNGFGVRGSYWYFDADDQVVTPLGFNQGGTVVTVSSAAPLNLHLNLNPGEFAIASSFLRLHVGDLEVAQVIQAGPWMFITSGGARYANLNQTYHFFEQTAGNANLISDQEFNGIGPTVAFESRRVLAGGLSLYALSRGSVLFGDYEHSVQQLAPAAADNNFAFVTIDHVLPVFEIEAGIECCKECCCCCCCEVFWKVGAVGQVWFNAGNSSNSSPVFGEVAPDDNIFDANSMNFENLSFFGLVASTGVRF